MDEILREISQIAEELKESGETDLDTCKVGILFPLIEYLGYDTTTVGDVSAAPLYTIDGSYKIDYGLRDLEPGSFKTVIKVIPEGCELDDEELSKLRSCLMQDPHINYVVVTDCFNYAVHFYDAESNTLGDVVSFNILDTDNIPEDALELLRNPVLNYEKQQYAEYEDEEYEGPKMVQIYEEKEEEPEPPPKKSGIKWWMVLLAQVVIVGILALIVFMFRNPDNQLLSFLNLGHQNELDYYDISSTLEVNLNKGTRNLDIQFYSGDIPQGGLIRFDIVNGEDSAILYGEVLSNGRCGGSYEIPEYWKNPSITVTAYLKFDEADHLQPAPVRAKFGELGEKIVGKEGAPSKYALNFTTVEYDSKAVQEYLLWMQQQQAANIKAERLKDFEAFEVRYDSLGNIKVLPAGYDMNANNITGNIHVYPQIFYDASTKIAHFYLVCGHISSVSWSMFRSVSFYADGSAWAYDIGNNEKKQQVTGQYITEWVYFDNYNISSLPGESAILASSQVSQISFNGAKAANFTLSDEEKDNISGAIALYNKYFSDRNNPPSTSWFESSSSTSQGGNGTPGNQGSTGTGTGINGITDENNFTLSYVYIPDRVLERDGTDQKALIKLEEAIETANRTGEATPSQTATYDIESHKYRVLNDSIKTIIMNEFRNAQAMLVYDQDYASFDNYFMLFFKYENPKEIEMGYIPYMYVMADRTVYLPVRESTGGTISDKCFASFVMSQTAYDQILEAIGNTEYEQVVDTEG